MLLGRFAVSSQAGSGLGTGLNPPWNKRWKNSLLLDLPWVSTGEYFHACVRTEGKRDFRGSQPGWAPDTEIQISHFSSRESGLAPNDPLLFKFQLIPLPSFSLCQQSKSDCTCLGHHLANQDVPNPEQRALFRIWECWALCLWNSISWSCTQNPPRGDNRMGRELWMSHWGQVVMSTHGRQSLQPPSYFRNCCSCK